MHSTTLRVDQLRLSPFNVRKKLHTDEKLTTIGESIVAEGLHHPLQVHPMKGNKKLFGIFAGGGRYRAISKMIEAGRLPDDYEIRVSIFEDIPSGQLVIRSIVENDVRYNLRDFETYAGIASAHALGESTDAIAEGLGREPIEILRWLRIGQLAKPVFEAFANGALTLDQAKAYGATEDHTLQAAAFEALRHLPDTHKRPSDIRAWMNFNDPVTERELAYVGEQRYLDAGGKLQLDLFSSDDERRRKILHPQMLRQLFDEKVQALKEDLRARAGREDLRFVARPPQTDFDTNDVHLAVLPKDGPVGSIVLPEGKVVAHIEIGQAGDVEVTWWWESRAAKYGNERPVARPKSLRPEPPAAQQLAAGHSAEPPATSADAISQDSIEILRSVRRAILRAALVNEARHGSRAIAVDWIVFAQLRRLIMPGQVPSEIGAITPALMTGPETAREFIASMPASKVWGDALATLSARPVLSDDNTVRAFLAFVGEPQETKDLAAAIVAGLTLDRSLNNDDYAVATHDELAFLCGIQSDGDVREYWTPTEKLLDRLPVEQRLAIAEPFVEAAAFGPWSRLKPREVTREVLAVVLGASASLRASMREAASTWVHPLLRFRPGTSADVDVAREVEAAE